MSKVSSTSYPSFSGSTLSIGDSKATANLLNGVLNSSYDMSDNESAIYNYSLSTLANILPQVNTFSPDVLKSMQSQVDAYQDKGIQTINDTYSPMITSLQNDIASRFGNLDNSMFKDDLSDIESNRAKAVSSFAQDVLAKKSELVSDELDQRYSLINLLSGMSNNVYSNALKAIEAALGGSSSANTYNSNLYNSINGKSSSSSASNLSSLLNSISLGDISFL